MALYQNLPDSYQIAHITVRPNIVLAPMAGVTDSVFRRLLLSLGGLGLVTTEMTNAASVSPKALKRHRLLEFLPQERPLAMQLSGNEPALVSEAARQVEALGADIIDLNCGCPSPKVTGGGHVDVLFKGGHARFPLADIPIVVGGAALNNVENVLAATAACAALGVEVTLIAAALRTFAAPEDGRALSP